MFDFDITHPYIQQLRLTVNPPVGAPLNGAKGRGSDHGNWSCPIDGSPDLCGLNELLDEDSAEARAWLVALVEGTQGRVESILNTPFGSCIMILERYYFRWKFDYKISMSELRCTDWFWILVFKSWYFLTNNHFLLHCYYNITMLIRD